MLDKHTTEACILASHVTSQLVESYMPLDIFETSIKSNVPMSCKESEIYDWCEIEWTNFVKNTFFETIKNKQACRSIKAKLNKKSFSLGKEIYRHIQASQSNGAAILGIHHAEYPELLRMIPNPPLSLTVLGSWRRLIDHCVAVVGARKASLFAIHQSFDLGLALSEEDICIVSGGAYGCDIACHQGALSRDGDQPLRTVVVFAGGLERLYPAGNEKVFSRLLERGGAFVSERLWYTQARPRDFPVRNRIISGLSSVLILMEAGLRSGSMWDGSLAWTVWKLEEFS